jgi:hypothetical protein
MAKGKKEETKPWEKLERDGSKGKRGICFSLFFVIFFFLSSRRRVQGKWGKPAFFSKKRSSAMNVLFSL